MNDWTLLYLFSALTVGVAALGASWALWVRTGQALVARFLLLHFFLTLSVVSGLLTRYFSLHLSLDSGGVVFGVGYLGSFVGRYGLTLMIPVFTHSLYGIPKAVRRDRFFAAGVLVLFLLQHVTELIIARDPWDISGDVIEDLALLAVVFYSLIVGARNLGENSPSTPPLLRRGYVVALFLAIPGVLNDTLFEDLSPWQFYPVAYGCCGWLIVASLCRFRSDDEKTETPTPERFLGAQGLSHRELEVAQLLLLGLPNQQIADRLFISTNTVKTHVRKIFRKLEVQNRVEFLTLCHRPSPKSLP